MDSERYLGGVRKALNNINSIISEAIIGLDVTKQEEIDNMMIKLDGTENKSRLGANAIWEFHSQLLMPVQKCPISFI